MESAAAGRFFIMEAQFSLRHITSSFLVRAFDITIRTCSELTNIYSDYKEVNTLKEAIISMYERTKPELFANLITDTKMAGGPSVYLRVLLATVNRIEVSDDQVRRNSILPLPLAITTAMAAARNLSLTGLGNVADEIIPFMKSKYKYHSMFKWGEFKGNFFFQH